jgi:hypothetical protein
MHLTSSCGSRSFITLFTRARYWPYPASNKSSSHYAILHGLLSLPPSHVQNNFHQRPLLNHPKSLFCSMFHNNTTSKLKVLCILIYISVKKEHEVLELIFDQNIAATGTRSRINVGKQLGVWVTSQF